MALVRTVIVGTGFMGRVHLEALRRLGFVEAIAISGLVDGEFEAALKDAGVQSIHICTPNALHFPMAEAALKADQATETFAGKTLGPGHYTATPIDTEDFGAIVFQMGERTRGAYTASQVSAERKNRLSVEIYGSKSSVAWDAERPDELWIGKRDANNQILLKDPSLMKPAAQSYADLPGGHSEGYDDTFKQIFRRFYQSILETVAVPEYPLQILEAELASQQRRAWVEVRDEHSGGRRWRKSPRGF